MPIRSHVLSFLAGALLVSQSVLAVPFPDEFVGPPSYSVMGCPHNVEWTDDVVSKSTGLSAYWLARFDRKFGFPPKRVCVADPDVIAGFIRSSTMRQNKAEEPDRALAQRTLTMLDDFGNIPADALPTALAQRQMVIEPPGGGGGQKAGYTTLAGGINSSSWTWLGPGNVGGRVRAFSQSKTAPQDMLVGSVSGGIQRTQNNGSSWTAMDPLMPNVAITCLIRNPLNQSIVYACTGEGMANTDAVRGLGIFRSTDSGVTWQQLPNTNPATAGTDWFYVNRLSIHPTDPNIMLVATNGGLFRSTDATAQNPTFTKVYEAVGPAFRKVMDVKFHPTDGSFAILGEGRHNNCTAIPCSVDGNGVAYSSNGGVSWTRTRLNTSAIGLSQGRVEVEYAPGNPNIVYAMVDMAAGQFYKSTDKGLTWTPNAPVSTPAHLGSQGWYGNAIWVSPLDANRVIVGGVTLRMSLNGGATWTFIGGSGSNVVHVDHHHFASDVRYGQSGNFDVFNGNDGGVYKLIGTNTATPGLTSPSWSTLNTNLGVTQLYGLAGKAGGRITAGTQDNGTLLWTGSTNWTIMWGNDGGRSAADSSDGNYLYGMTQYGGIVRYTQGLAASPPAYASQYICTGITDASCNFNNPSPKILFIPPMALDHITNTTLYLGAQQLWRSMNIKAPTNTSVAWTSIKPAIASNQYISAIAISPGNSSLVWVGYQDGALACTSNATAATPTWTTVSQNISRYVTAITIDPSNPNRVFVAYGGYTTPNLRVTSSGCTATPSWTSIHNQLPAAPVRAIEINPTNPSWLYAGTEVGLFVSENNGANWSTTNDGPGTVSVEELLWLDSTTLLLGSHGRGAFRATVGGAAAPVSFTSAPPLNGIVNVPYSHTYTASGSPAPTFSLSAGSFPPGLTLNSSTGVLSGNPTTAGSSTGTVSATNAGGSATQNFSITIDPGTPGAPTIGTATPGNGQATIQFFPGPSGASPVTSFTVTCTPSGSASGPASPITVTGLTNGTLYSCSARATNTQGTGPASGTVSVTPANTGPTCSAPSAPGGSFGTAYSHSFAATGSPTYALTSGALPTGVSLNTSNGTASGTPSATGTFTGVITATNAGGSCTKSFSITIAAVVPGAPTIGTGTAGTGSATISFSAPASNGGSAITSYTATCGAQSAPGPSSPITVTGLAGGVSVSCSVKANNAVGASAASGSVSVTPNSLPSFTSGAAPGGTFNVAYSHDYNANGFPAPTFSVTSGALPGGITLNSTSGTLSGTPNAGGTFTGVVTATNAAGTATQNFSITIASTAPGAPTIGSATPGNGQASISFSAPASNGGSAITGYTATCNPGGITGTGASSPITVTGLTAGTTYTCSVTATNAAGTSAASGTVSVTPVSGPAFTNAAPAGGTFGTAYAHVYTASGAPAPTFSLTSGSFPPGVTLSGPNLAGTPSAAGTFTGVVTATNSGGSTTQNFSITIAPTVPGAPTIGAATPGVGQATVSFSAPASNGGAAITSFTATCNPGALSAPGAASPITVTGLTNGTAYTCSVRATNSAGTGAASGNASVTPGAAPAFTSPAAGGGTYNVAYSHTFTASGAPAPAFNVTSGALPPGLTLNSGTGALTGTPTTGGTFTGVVTASNSMGNATQAFSINIATTLPGAPTIGAGTPGPGFAMVGFTPPANNGGAAITSYTATCTPGPFGGSAASSPVTVNGLTNGTAYTCSVTATNAVGTGPASGTVVVTPAATPAFASAPPAAGTLNVAYSHTYTANGTPAPTFSLTSGAFPNGLTLNGSTGALSGTPTVLGTFNGVVTATNSGGTATQNFSIVIGAAVPGAPTIGTATPGNGQATIAFTPPASNGGATITSYTATCNPGGLTGSAAGSPVTVTGLTNGTTYSCSVKANNSAGASAASGSVSVTPGVTPAFTSGAAPGGTFNVAYAHTFTASGAPAPTFGVTSGALPGGLTLASNGALSGTPTTAGTFTGVVTATNASGSATQNFSITIGAVAPGAPTIGSAASGVGQATIAFTPPASNGGATITNYTVSCAPQPNGPTRSASGAASPITVSNMSNGTAYLCSVVATNSAGTSPASGNVGVTPGAGPAITSVAPPGGTFGAAYAHTYTASGSPAPTFGLTSGAFPAGITLNGTTGALTGTPAAAGTFTGVVTATNSGGSVTQAFSITIAATVPGAPTIGSATPASGQLTIAFTAPASNGGSPITSYSVTCNPGAISASGAASPITVTGLANGTLYTCSARANNAVGASAASATVSGTPSSTPTFTSAAAPNGVLGVAYSHTFAAGGSPAPTFSLTSGAFPTGLTLNATTGALTGTPGAAGTFTGVVTATNTAGTATQGFSILIASVPGAPTIGSATPGNGQATISFTAPASNGGSPITSYTVTCNPGAVSSSGASSPITVSGLANGTAYSCSVRAFNAVGASAPSSTLNVTPASGIVLALTGVVSRKVHGNAGPFDLPLNTQPISGSVVVEPRDSTAGHKIVFQFNDTIFAAGAATSVNAGGTPLGTVTRVISGNAIEVTITGVPDCRRLTVSVPGVNGGLNVSVNVAFLLGDVDNNYRVDSTDILRIKGKFTGGSLVTAATFVYDLDLSGGVSQSDVNAAKNNTSDPGV